jgi:hypothetical protein
LGVDIPSEVVKFPRNRSFGYVVVLTEERSTDENEKPTAFPERASSGSKSQLPLCSYSTCILSVVFAGTVAVHDTLPHVESDAGAIGFERSVPDGARVLP